MTMEFTGVAEPLVAEPRLDPWLSMWTRPRRSVRQLVQAGVDGRVLLLAALSGIVQTLDRASGRNMGDELAAHWIVLIAMVFGPLFGVLGLYVAAWLVALTGSWLGGRADARTLRIPIAWAALPAATAGLALWLVGLVLFGADLFTSETPRLEGNLGLALLMMLWGLALVVVAVWSLVLAAKAVAEVQGYRSAWRGLANIVLPGLVIIGIVAALFGIIGVMIPMVAQ